MVCQPAAGMNPLSSRNEYMEAREKTIGILAMAGTAFLWSIAGLFIKVIDWNPFAIAGARSFIASLVILAYLKKPALNLSPPQLAAGVANAVTMMLFVAANKTTTAANAILLQYIAPVLTAIFGALILGERPRIEHWTAFILAAVGMAIMFIDRMGGGSDIGNIIALASGATFSLYFIFMRMQKGGSPLESILLSHWITAGTCLAISLFMPLPCITPGALTAVAILGIIQIGLSSILFSVAIKRVSAVSANLIAVIEPVFNPLWVFLALGETPAVNAIAGGGIIVAAVTAATVCSAVRK